MRTLIALPLLAFALVACKVTKDEANDTVTAELNGEVAENAASDVGNLAEDVGNEVEERAENVEVDVDVDTNKAN